MNLLSPIEKEVEALLPKHALVCTREERYDEHAGLFFSPLAYKNAPLLEMSVTRLPADEWVQESFENLVRIEFGRNTPQQVETPHVTPDRIVSCDAADVYRDALDRFERLVYGSHLEQILREVEDKPIEEQLFRLLSSPQYMGRDLARYYTPAAFTEFIGATADLSVGLRLLVPALPFRDQNPFRTADEPWAITLAEVGFLLRLHIIALGIFQVVPTGAHWIVVADGTAYAEALGVGDKDASQYVERLRSVRSALNLHRTVSIVDLRDLMRGLSDGGTAFECDKIAISIRESLNRLWEEGTSHQHFSSLLQGIRWNINLRPYCRTDDERDVVWRWLNTPAGDASIGNAQPLDERLREAALSYASVNLAEKYLDAIRTRLPGCVRATTHPKLGQLPVPRKGSVSPWNGVAHLEEGQDLSNVSVDPLFRLAGKSLTAHVDPNYSGGTAYYTYGRED
jgi:hypothetical protein